VTVRLPHLPGAIRRFRLHVRQDVPMPESGLSDALSRLEAEWVRLGAPIAGLLRPGLSDDEIDGQTASLGLTVPPELRAWWRWHDGADRGEQHGFERTIGPGGYAFLPLYEALHQYESEMQIANRVRGEAPVVWGRSWLPFMVNSGPSRLYVDCDRVTPWKASPVRAVTWEWEEPEVDRAASLWQAVELWVWLLDSDYYQWSEQGWAYDWEAIPIFLRLTGLALTNSPIGPIARVIVRAWTHRSRPF
jgi:hypothetical protein